MRQTACGEIQTSVLGFGCGSVMGRVGRAQSLRAMNAAWDAGITLFDTARSYGFGEAEAVLGEFLGGKREQAVIATKYGIAPQRLSPLKRVVVPMVRAAKKLPGAGRLKRGGVGPVVHGEFSVAGLRSSLETSLRALKTDHVDVLFLHEASAAVMQEDALMLELEALVRAGKVLRVGLYGSAAVCGEGLAHGPAVLGSMQFGADVLDPVAMGLADVRERRALMIGNHPFGSADRVSRVKAMLEAMAVDETVPEELRDKLWGLGWDGLLEALLGMIVDSAGVDALVLSMMEERHLRKNVRAVEMCRFGAGELKLMRGRMLAHSPLV